MNKLGIYCTKETKAAPLAVFRIIFGLLMLVSLVRFWYNGWIETLYIEPIFHFHYQGFSWVQVPGSFTYVLFILAGLSCVGIILGYRYRISIISFFLLFTYIELMDKTTYLNHYYFISLLSFLLIFLPMQRYFSIDAIRLKDKAVEFVPQWTIASIKLLIAIVYIYAGLAKINHDWLINAMPMTIWLPTKMNLPLLGSVIHEKFLHYLFSWAGMIYDVFIVFFLLLPKTRKWAFLTVIIFHLLTRALFPIGMFPYVMIFSTLIFFSPAFHDRILEHVSNLFKINKEVFDNSNKWPDQQSLSYSIIKKILIVFFIIQILLPLRYLMYSGNVFWTEQGYRFSWRVMLMEKTGYANFKIVNSETGARFYVQNDDFLTAFQEKEMATQVDFIIEYAHYLADHFRSQGHKNIQVFVESYAALNGRKSQIFVKPDIDLLQEKIKFDNNLILRLND